MTMAGWLLWSSALSAAEVHVVVFSCCALQPLLLLPCRGAAQGAGQQAKQQRQVHGLLEQMFL
jgi:hypothetical protein